MAFTYAPDFVVKRRRRRSRQPVDPCLGFYEDIPTSPSIPLSASTPVRTVCSSEPIEEVHTVDLYGPNNPGDDDAGVRQRLSVAPPDSDSPAGIQTPVLLDKDANEPLTVEQFLRRAATTTSGKTPREY
ncbi:hypothetical protein L226DRAFT_570943 [Lentinus tigrinus ALCF2SS1-7]|uniref:Uncharacterized protein n=1 Tax=Lentinus tigrinus ALCF2SS1-6 TaxID=1328759 RepID=A0A5C2SC09_9APHY|nr:hypothetical protein L227DRAFT_610788 [Lentinus tigrinus ALCF2SS1-6]RPD75306.1 hypothetical protein L226DRAFT_570943 [Lentinus tigrinus ALCF2SS1-7]